MNTSAEIRLWGTVVGAVTLSDGQRFASFEYNPSFVQTGIQIAPSTMPLGQATYRFSNLSVESFHGLPGLLSDSLPDKFGNALINAWLARQGRLPESFNAVERLCYTGRRGMGALEYYPILSDASEKSEVVNVSKLVELASLVLANRNNLHAFIDECDKANIRHWLIKFSGVNGNKDKESDDVLDFGLVEYAYYLMAKTCGINMSDCRLLDDGENCHFMTRRFDRTLDGGKLHMLSLAGLCHFDFSQAGTYSYEQVFSVMNKLGCNHPEKVDFFRRMIFNIVACNCDDHVKNISFLMDKHGVWHLAPAYDVCFAYNPEGKWTSAHQMTINGKTSGFTKEDFVQCRKISGLKEGEVTALISEVCESVKKWRDFAGIATVRGEMTNTIEKCFCFL